MRLTSILLLGVAALLAQPSHTNDRWAPFAFLIGGWTGEGGGAGPGQGAGGFSFRLDQDRKILIRKNRSDYPATRDHPAYSHTDLTIVYQEPGESELHAIYFDNEDHVIHYRVEPASDGNNVQFLSEVEASQPRYRLTYRKAGPDTVAIKFEIAPAGTPEAFATYIEAQARRTAR